MDKSSILLSGKQFEVHLFGPCQPEGRLEAGYSFSINQGRNKTIGCFDVIATTMAIANWKNNSKLITNGESLKRLFLQVLPSIDVPVDYKITTGADSIYFKILFSFNETKYDPKERTYYINPENNPEDLVEKLVYDGEITDDKVQANLLRYLMRSLREDSSKTTSVAELKASFFLDDQMFEYNLGHLWNTKRVTEHGVNSGGVDSREVTISTIGIEYLNQGQTPAPTYVHIGDVIDGDKIEATTYGDNSPNVIKSTNVRIDFALFSKLETEIEEKYTGTDKAELVSQVQEAQELAKTDLPENRNKILRIMGLVMSRASDVATIASFALQIYQFFHTGKVLDPSTLAFGK